MVRVQPAVDFGAAREIFREYARSLPPGHVCVAAFEREVAALESWYSCIWLAYDEQAVAGCAAMRRLDGAIPVCEMKRLFVRPQWRGTGLGRRLVEQVIDTARKQGFQLIRLDTLPDMAAAYALYRNLGFQEIPSYGDNPAGAICLELAL